MKASGRAPLRMGRPRDKGIPPLGRDLGRAPGRLFCTEREETWEGGSYVLVGSGKWLTELVKGLERARLDSQGQEALERQHEDRPVDVGGKRQGPRRTFLRAPEGVRGR